MCCCFVRGVRNVKTELVSWQGDNPNLAKGRKDVAFSKTYVDVGHQLTRAQLEMNYAGADKATRLLPYMVASDLNPLEDPPPLSLVWHFRLDSVWAPGLVYDPKQPWPQAFGRPPDNMLAALKSVRNPYHVVFNFGYRD
ncbi:hypothetical protein B5M09_004700 [Aphanomyces astaci]|uniref:Uncharacterized protein n=1 Tax=Aphanomyces astaci TaxID=112090 RepID=A0A425DBP0_APHAT|nr:hypothetical protein B5M09_004700 [Aphanomyces astaci]